MKTPRPPGASLAKRADYRSLLDAVSVLLKEARRAAARTVNSILTAAYWEIGRRIVEFEQGGKSRAKYGEMLLPRLSADLTSRFGRGFSVDHLELMRAFYVTYPPGCVRERGWSRMSESPIRKTTHAVNSESPIRKLAPDGVSRAFPLSWTHYTHLLRRSTSAEARAFYEEEAQRGGWSVRQLDRQIDSQFYERTALSRRKAAMLAKGAKPRPEDAVAAEEEIKDPSVSYACAHWIRPGENPPVGLILCARKDEVLARYALENLPNKVLAAEYKTTLPDETLLAEEIARTRKLLDRRRRNRP